MKDELRRVDWLYCLLMAVVLGLTIAVWVVVALIFTASVLAL